MTKDEKTVFDLNIPYCFNWLSDLICLNQFHSIILHLKPSALSLSLSLSLSLKDLFSLFSPKFERTIFHCSSSNLVRFSTVMLRWRTTIHSTKLPRSSMTRFVKISPLWQKYNAFADFKSLVQCLAKFRNYFGKFVCCQANLHCCKQPNIGK